MTWVPRGGGSQEGTTGDLLSHQPEFMGTPLNYYELRESHQVSPRVRGEGHEGEGGSSRRGLIHPLRAPLRVGVSSGFYGLKLS